MTANAINVFISYHRKSSALLAHLLRAELLLEGIRAFVDTREDKRPGAFQQEIERAIKKSDCFVCVLGAKTLESENVKKEIEWAANYDVTMIPIFQPDYALPVDAPSYIQQLVSNEGVTITDDAGAFLDAAVSRLLKLLLHGKHALRVQNACNVFWLAHHLRYIQGGFFDRYARDDLRRNVIQARHHLAEIGLGNTEMDETLKMIHKELDSVAEWDWNIWIDGNRTRMGARVFDVMRSVSEIAEATQGSFDPGPAALYSKG